MLDTMTFTKIASGFLGAFLVYLLGKWGVEELYATDVHYDDTHVAGYSIEIPEADDAGAEVIEVAFADVYATADASAGERSWRQCGACHAQDAGVHGVGPSLHGIVDREIAAIGEFAYSDALASLGGSWTPEELSGFLESPRSYAPGTAMGYSGMSDIEDRANLIAYLATLN